MHPYYAALAARKVYEIAIDVLTVDIVASGQSYPLLPGLTGPGDMADGLAHLETDMALFKTLHQGVYQGFHRFKRLPTDYGIRALWWVDTPSGIGILYIGQALLSNEPRFT